MDQTFRTICLYNMGVLCFLKSVLCNLKSVLCGMGVLCNMGELRI